MRKLFQRKMSRRCSNAEKRKLLAQKYQAAMMISHKKPMGSDTSHGKSKLCQRKHPRRRAFTKIWLSSFHMFMRTSHKSTMLSLQESLVLDPMKLVWEVLTIHAILQIV
ncbi:hypothetical protein O6H91_19G011600 [Diphasiastrum complanatum]|uniref:Uncharacterized protein n=1 Tax=Diphasiastrum complanatum TaxID=34168 RepID=A0ACC2ASR3_DIPCM|nr:hypothetical protein O6H91_19G011600 [Diphasiastrum complanatum]